MYATLTVPMHDNSYPCMYTVFPQKYKRLMKKRRCKWQTY